jgi:TolB-like protein
VQDLPLRLLAALLEQPGELLAREQARQRLWPPDVHLDFDSSLNAAVSRLREALGDSAAEARYVATEPRRGWRFVAPVEVVRPWRRASTRHLVGLGLFVVVLMALLLPRRLDREPGGSPTARRDRVMLAVLPFEERGEPTGYLGEGLTEELIGLLGGADPQRLAVIARSSVVAFGSGTSPIAEVARALGADHILEGSVSREGDAVRVTARLVSAADATVLWSDAYDRRFGGILSLQREIAAEVARALEVRLLAPPEVTAAGDPRLQELYLRGRYLLGRYLLGREHPKSLREALTTFEAAQRLAPDAARTALGLAATYLASARTMSNHRSRHFPPPPGMRGARWPPSRRWPRPMPSSPTWPSSTIGTGTPRRSRSTAR